MMEIPFISQNDKICGTIRNSLMHSNIYLNLTWDSNDSWISEVSAHKLYSLLLSWNNDPPKRKFNADISSICAIKWKHIQNMRRTNIHSNTEIGRRKRKNAQNHE